MLLSQDYISMTIDTFYNPKIITTTLIHFNRIFVLMLFLDGQTRALDDASVNAASSLVREALVLLQKSQGTQKIVSRLDARLQQHLKAFANDWLSDDPLSFQTNILFHRLFFLLFIFYLL